MTPVFDLRDPDAQARSREFFTEHGYAVIAPVLTDDELTTLRSALDAVWTRCAADQSLSRSEYLKNISQWRDLWRDEDVFSRTLSDPRIWGTAAQFMGGSGARLLHDHVIAKPANASATIPWHQDYPYWPVDIDRGISCWCPLDDIGRDGGCLEVIAGSHRWGESPPIDFIRDDRSALDARSDRLHLPCAAGGLVALHSLTWHRSGPNHATGVRPAYITLWIPPDARYAPEHAPWHPSNEHITVTPGEILNEDWFPCYGEFYTGIQATPQSPPTPVDRRDGLSMFDASKTIARQLRTILTDAGQPAEGQAIDQMLTRPDAITHIVHASVARGIVQPADEIALRAALQRLHIASEAYRLHRARNVYNGAYVEWWQIAGAAWESALRDTARREQP
ncbi:MAG: phytanoyl-CoA dioxygenase family protein [Myxococcota bacterium]